MTGSTLFLVLISVVVVIVLAAWIVLVFYADAHPAWRRPGASATARPLDCRSTARPAAHQETRTSPPGRDTAVPTANLPGGKPTAAARAPARAVPS